MNCFGNIVWSIVGQFLGKCLACCVYNFGRQDSKMENVDEELSDKIDVEDIDKYRKHWEIDKHWELRKSFLLAHHETIPANRLLCLAQCYANIEVLHNGFVFFSLSLSLLYFSTLTTILTTDTTMR